MTERDERSAGLVETVRAHAEAVRAQLARISALRAASPDIVTPAAGVNPLDLLALDPLTPGAFPGIGAGHRPRPGPDEKQDPAAVSPGRDMRAEPVEAQTPLALRRAQGTVEQDRSRRRRRSRSCWANWTR